MERIWTRLPWGPWRRTRSAWVLHRPWFLCCRISMMSSTRRDFSATLRSCNARSAPGLEGVSYGVLFWSCQGILTILFHLDVVRFEFWLLSFQSQGILTFLFHQDVVRFEFWLLSFQSRLRQVHPPPISLTLTLCKTFKRLVQKRLEFLTENKSWIPANQFGFSRGRSSMDWVSCVVFNRHLTELGVPRRIVYFVNFLTTKRMQQQCTLTILWCTRVTGTLIGGLRVSLQLKPPRGFVSLTCLFRSPNASYALSLRPILVYTTLWWILMVSRSTARNPSNTWGLFWICTSPGRFTSNTLLTALFVRFGVLRALSRVSWGVSSSLLLLFYRGPATCDLLAAHEIVRGVLGMCFSTVWYLHFDYTWFELTISVTRLQDWTWGEGCCRARLGIW